MKTGLDETITELNENHGTGRLVDVALVSVYKGGQTSIQYTPGIEDRASHVIGYLTALCGDLTQFVKR